ncbi:hypothetical protein [Microbacterium sp. MYb66]|uniref:hypothetical protein n=1 Tax=Microbacterium sp. MYb66 TaxID=1848692 RepID=UPI000D007C17|nr:hypothetical protein [Microbacterium sp. MYb66]PRA83324.1 hypothetical protein CQ045_02760 [Microbacterium sp. MYb66]
MTSPTPLKGRKLTVGVIVAAVVGCAACCAGPLLGIAASVGAASLLGAYWVPALLIVAALAAAVTVVLMVRRRRARACRVPQGPQSVALQHTRPEAVSAGEPSES